MKSVLSLLSLILLSLPVLAQNELIAPELTAEELITHLQNNFSVTSPQSYNAARDAMFEQIDGPDGLITCVYTGYTISFTDRTDAQDGNDEPGDFNTEHIWPQSFFDSNLPMRSDIHHLYPTRQDVNGARNNFPFAEIQDIQTSIWYRDNSNQSSIPTSNIDEYSELLSNTSFEPREDHKGNVARAIFYFWTIYQNNTSIVTDGTDNAAFFNGMKEVLLEWHFEDPVDAEEVSRSEAIAGVQGNRNPFVHDTTLVRRAYFGAGPVQQGRVPDPVTGEITYINAPIFDLTFALEDKDTTVSFLFNNELTAEDTSGNAVTFTDYESIFEATVSWDPGSSSDERIATNVQVIQFTDSMSTSGEPEFRTEQASEISLNQNYPNPFNPATDISYRLSEPDFVTLTIYDMLGREVEVLVNATQASGDHVVRFDATDLSSGVYMYELKTPAIRLTRFMTLIK